MPTVRTSTRAPPNAPAATAAGTWPFSAARSATSSVGNSSAMNSGSESTTPVT
jgi:hypothetical protein